ncbi:hypothetical protein TNCV_1553211 [Trichonephila clavipes]|nr:hypothetical protein TNCV_1553211 [Trichonephila clavipes]
MQRREDVETWMACDADDCELQILNDDNVTSMQKESAPVVYETDEDEDNNNEIIKSPSNGDALSASAMTAMEWLPTTAAQENQTLQQKINKKNKNEFAQWYIKIRSTIKTCICCCYLCHLIGKGQITAHEIHHGKGLLTPVLNRSFEHHTGDRTLYLGSTPILRENTLEEGQGPPNSHPLQLTSREDLRVDGCLKSTLCREDTIHLQTCMFSPGFETRPYGATVSVANHYTR